MAFETFGPMLSDPTVAAPCGHTATLDDSFISPDVYQCPTCQIRWSIRQRPAEILASGYSIPGARKVEISNPPMHHGL